MIHVGLERRRRSFWWAFIAVSVGLHLAALIGADHVRPSAPRVYGAGQVDFAYNPPPPPEEVPAPADPPKPAPPKPKPNAEAPANTEPPAAAPPKEVFGVTKESVESADGGVAVRVGNTLAKQMEEKATDLAQVRPLSADPGGPAALSQLTSIPRFRRRIDPVYPEQARRDGVQGQVLLQVLIDAEGRVKAVQVLKEPGGGLGPAAAAAVQQSMFYPGTIGPKPVPVRITIPYRFVL